MQSKIENSSNHTNKIYYWNGLIDPRGLASAHHETIAKIIAGNYLELDLEKLSGHNVYSVRINKSDRLLFTTIVMNGQPYLMLLDEVLNHDYAKSRFLKPSVLKNYLELHGKPISEELIDKHFAAYLDDDPNLPQSNQTDNVTEYCRIDFYNQKFIELDETQLNVATKTSLPLIISGAPGSGKSCIALLILSQYIETNLDNEYPILYVTESENLAASMKGAWQVLPIAQNLDADAVQFKSYQQLIESLADVANMTFVNKDHCLIWLLNEIKYYKKLPNHYTFPEDFYANTELMYQEFRIIAGCATLEDYIKIGKKQSLYHDNTEQKWLFDAFTRYQRQLMQENCIHIPFYPLSLQNRYKRIVVDEAQDLSHLQLKILASLASDKQICFCEDYRQSLSDNKSKISFLKSLLYSWGHKENHIVLSSSYRCPEAVIRMANTISGLKSMVTGYGEQDITVPERQIGKGKVKWFDSLSKNELADLQEAAASPDFAIITLPQYKQEAMTLFKTPLVFTAEEIKGLEYNKILAYGLFDDPMFKEADKIIGTQSTNIKKTAGHRAKENQGNEQYGPSFSAVYTAFSRALDSLYIFQKERHHLRNMTPLLKAAITKNMDITPDAVPEVTINQWFEEAKTQLNQGNIDIARQIWLEKLHKTAEEFEKFGALFRPTCNSDIVKDNKNIIIETKQPVIHTNKKQQINLNKIPDEITRLLKNITETTLSKFLKHKNAIKYLYHTPLEDGACLFTTLFSNPKYIIAIVTCLTDSVHHKVFSEATIDALCRPFVSPTDSRITNLTALLSLILDKKGRDVFSKLLKINPQMSKAINAEAFYTTLDFSAIECRDYSPFYILIATSGQNDLLKTIFIHNPDLAKEISPEHLYQAFSIQVMAVHNVSPLHWLTRSRNGFEALEIIFTANPKLYQFADAKTLFTPFSSINSVHNISTLHSLSRELEGQILLLRMFAKNSLLASSPDLGGALCSPFTNQDSAFTNTSALYWLASMEDGRTLLDLLLITNPKLAKSITAEALCLPLVTGKRKNATPLFWLSTCPEGCEILKSLLTNNPKLAQTITAKELCLVPGTNTEKNISPLALLSTTTKGCAILDILQEHNPKLSTLIAWYKNKIAVAEAGFFSRYAKSTTEEPVVNNQASPSNQ